MLRTLTLCCCSRLLLCADCANSERDLRAHPTLFSYICFQKSIFKRGKRFSWVVPVERWSFRFVNNQRTRQFGIQWLIHRQLSGKLCTKENGKEPEAIWKNKTKKYIECLTDFLLLALVWALPNRLAWVEIFRKDIVYQNNWKAIRFPDILSSLPPLIPSTNVGREGGCVLCRLLLIFIYTRPSPTAGHPSSNGNEEHYHLSPYFMHHTTSSCDSIYYLLQPNQLSITWRVGVTCSTVDIKNK